ncbi:uncharacterized protein LOC100577748 isoform X1 [Apis mellifera]|uniref:Uncharacterized protein LOC100577748 isoform X1 n=1 Tax=Apis mellifera TaxID=7460 RepID=A0A7M7GTH4_APIME|nr:uncharacterized protein LOC100577748 isoform X1 [Apis mellifera]|eukprot:XP_006566250.1 uncharacterized protein LOC100577748 isoform X1 [Apis mellifera]
MQRWCRHDWTSNLDNRSREFRYKGIDSNLTECGKGEKLWCYQCNTNLRNRHTRECNDPYPSSYFDLTLCPRNESHHCLKSIIDYGDVLVTVRGCVPSREIDGYCQQTEHFPGSSIKCSFCDDYACNSQNSNRVSNDLISIILTFIPSIIPIIYLF